MAVINPPERKLAKRTSVHGWAKAVAAAAAVFYTEKSKQDPGLGGLASRGGPVVTTCPITGWMVFKFKSRFS